jgi:hypothetical protein
MRRLGLPFLLALMLAAPANAGAAAELLDTLTVDPDSRSVMSGTVTLKKGTRYVIEVTGTMKSTGMEGRGYLFDALYCYAGVNFDHEECEDERRDPNNKAHRNHNWWISAGPGDDWRLADQFTTTGKPLQDTPVVAYDPNHAYSTGFYPPADGPIKAVGYYGRFPDPNEQNDTSGSFTIKVFGEAATPSPSPSPSATPSPSASPSPSPSPTPSPCASAADRLARAAQAGCKDLGATWIMGFPEAMQATDIGGVKIPPDVKQIFLDAGITDAKDQQLIASIIIKAKHRKLLEDFYGCLAFGGLLPPSGRVFGSGGPPDPGRPGALRLACSKIVAEAAGAAGTPLALSSAAGCKVFFYPLYTKAQKRSAKKRKRVKAAVKKAFAGGCAISDNNINLTMRSKQKGVPLAALTGRTLGARLSRTAGKGGASSPNSKLLIRWRKP